jgi:hypothetical protein
LLAFATTFASAGNVPCTGTPASCGFGTPDGSASGSLSSTNHFDKATYVENVYYNSHTGVYTYVFTVLNTGVATLVSADTYNSDGYDKFDGNLNYGTMTSQSSSGEHATGFSFNPNSLTVDYSNLTNGKTVSFYTQSTTGPVSGDLTVSNAGPTNPGSSLDPAAEPGVLALLGSLFLASMLGMPFASWLRQNWA